MIRLVKRKICESNHGAQRKTGLQAKIYPASESVG